MGEKEKKKLYGTKLLLASSSHDEWWVEMEKKRTSEWEGGENTERQKSKLNNSAPLHQGENCNRRNAARDGILLLLRMHLLLDR